MDEQSDVDDSGVEELDESEEAMLFWEFFNSKWYWNFILGRCVILVVPNFESSFVFNFRGPLVIFITTCHDIEPL